MSSYILPRSLHEALDAIAEGEWRILAGGTDFYPQLNDKPLDFNIIDINRLEELRGIRRNNDHWRMGAMVTWTELLETELPPVFNSLKLAAREIGSVQIQNAATLAGNLCNASPAADSVPPLLTLDASVELQSASGIRHLPVSDFIKGNRTTDRSPDEIMTAILLPADRDNACTHFLKLGTRKYLVISISMVSILIKASTEGLIELSRISVGSCSAVAQRLQSLEALVTGQYVTANLDELVTAEHLAPLSPIDDVRATAEYRMNASEELVRRVLRECTSGIAAHSR